jgi:parvulin-like peptidyl-prolyl isomerase
MAAPPPAASNLIEVTISMRFNLISSLVFACILAIALPVHAEVIDRLLATVDEEAILLSDVMLELGPFAAQLRQQGVGEQEYARQMDRQVRQTLEQQIESKLLLREARRSGLEVDEDIVEEQINKLRNNPLFRQELEMSGKTLSEFREAMRKKLLAQNVARQRINQYEDAVRVSESEVAQYYEDHRERFERPEEVRLRQIFLIAPEGADNREAVRARLEQVRAELTADADFGELARAYSEGPAADDGGYIGWKVRGDLIPVLEEAAFALEEGEISPIIESSHGFHLLRADERREAGLRTLDELRAEIAKEVRTRKAEALFDRWVAELRDRSQVRVFLR